MHSRAREMCKLVLGEKISRESEQSGNGESSGDSDMPTAESVRVRQTPVQRPPAVCEKNGAVNHNEGPLDMPSEDSSCLDPLSVPFDNEVIIDGTDLCDLEPPTVESAPVPDLFTRVAPSHGTDSPQSKSDISGTDGDNDYFPDSETDSSYEGRIFTRRGISQVPQQVIDPETDSEALACGLNSPQIGLGLASNSDEEIEYISNSDSESSFTRRSRSRVRRQVIIPESSLEESDEASTPKRGRKRVREENKWKCNIRKKKTITGQSYTSKRGKEVPAKQMRPSCSPCRQKCSQKVAMQVRQAIFNRFWSPEMTWNMKRQFIISCVKEKPVQRKRVRGQSQRNRTCTSVYTLTTNGEDVTVCKKMFLNTLAISETMVRNAIKKAEHGVTKNDERGCHTPSNKINEDVKDSIRSHIRCFPKYASHYSREKTTRDYLGNHLNIHKMYELYVDDIKAKYPTVKDEDIAKEWLYRKIFTEEFNLGFALPSTDTCDQCDMYVIKMREIENVELMATLKEDYEKHLHDSSNRYELKRKDKEYSKENPQTDKVLTVDLQKCLPTPLLTNGLSFYLRKLWTFNFTIADCTANKNECVMWDESKGGRGGNELASGLLKWCEHNLANTNIKNLTIWSDNCPGQNKNVNLIVAYLWILHKYPNLECINHKYLLKGHTHMEVDGIHSIIERKKKNQLPFSIVIPWDWQQLVKSCSNSRNNISVLNMEIEDFKKFSDLVEGSSSPFVHRKKSTTGQNVPYSQMVWIQFQRASFGTMRYKTYFEENEFQEVCLYRNVRKGIDNLRDVTVLRPIRSTQKPISNLKHKDLITALQWVPADFHSFYLNIPHNETTADL